MQYLAKHSSACAVFTCILSGKVLSGVQSQQHVVRCLLSAKHSCF